MRQGIPSAGNFLHQELAIITGAVEAMVVDVQCIMQALPDAGRASSTPRSSPPRPRSRSPAPRTSSSTSTTPSRSPSRSCAWPSTTTPTAATVHIPDVSCDVVPGFSHEYINYMLGGSYRSSFRPLNDAIMSGPHPRRGGRRGLQQPAHHPGRHARLHRAPRLLKNDVLVVETGCGAIAAASTASCWARRRWSRPAPACARCARRSASRRCCTWAPASTTPAS